jgi:hypothetical protein
VTIEGLRCRRRQRVDRVISAWPQLVAPNVTEQQLVDVIISSRSRLVQELGPRYDSCINQASASILMRMAKLEIPSPLLAAIELGADDNFEAIVGDREYTFQLLIQAALHLLTKSVSIESGN